MESTKIEQLLEKYWNGDTTVDEEQQLQHYFNQEEVPDHLQKIAGLFRSYRVDQQFKQLNQSFDEALFQRIEKSERRFRWRPLLSIAASVLLLLAAALWVQDVTTQDLAEPVVVHDTYEDPRLAYEQTKEALLLVSTLMNKGTQQVEKLEKFHEAQETFKSE